MAKRNTGTREPLVPYLFPLGASLGADNSVLHARAQRHKVSEFAGPVSIKTVLTGVVAWISGGREFAVDPNTFLVLGDGEVYSMNIEETRAVETCCAFFRRGFVEGIAEDATTPVESGLDNPERKPPMLPYLSRLHQGLDGSVLRRVQTLAARCSRELQPSGFEEDFLVLARDLLMLYDDVRRRAAKVPGVKASTRQELLRRIETGREFLHAHGSEAVSLEAAARAACVSRYHFHRTFTQVHGQTPHAYLTALRLGRAQALLRAGWKVSDVVPEVGFSSASSFRRLFRVRYGVAPSSERAQEIRKIGPPVRERLAIGSTDG